MLRGCLCKVRGFRVGLIRLGMQRVLVRTVRTNGFQRGTAGGSPTSAPVTVRRVEVRVCGIPDVTARVPIASRFETAQLIDWGVAAGTAIASVLSFALTQITRSIFLRSGVSCSLPSCQLCLLPPSTCMTRPCASTKFLPLTYHCALAGFTPDGGAFLRFIGTGIRIIDRVEHDNRIALAALPH